MAARAVKPRQPIAPAPEGQNPDGSRKLTRGLAAVPPPAQAVAHLAESTPAEEDVRSISQAISRGLSGMKDIQGLLSHQPSIHRPIRTPTPSGILKQGHMDSASVMPPFASGAAVGTMQSGSFQSHDPSHGLPGETPGGGGASARLPPLTAGIGSNRSTGALSAASSAVSTAAESAQAPTGMPHSLPKAQAGQLLGQSSSTDGLLPRLKRSTEGQLQGRAPAGLPRSPARGSGPTPVLQLNLREAAVDTRAQPSMPQAVTKQQDALSSGSPALAAASMSASASASQSAAAFQTMRTAGSAMSDHSLYDGAGAARALSAVQQSKHSSYSRSRTVSFEPADAAAMQGAADSGSVKLGVEPAVQQHSDAAQASRAQKQMFHPLRSYDERVQTGGTDNQTELSTVKGSQRLVSMGSSLTAVSETMQDRMLAGGMMHKHVDHTSADRCVWPRSILKLQGAEQLPSVRTSCLSKTASIVEPPKEGVSGVRQVAEGNRSMPAQLARHQSSLNQVSRRPDFAAAMDAVRASWREEEIGKSTVCTVQSGAVVPDSIHDDAQSSLDTIWASIHHDA